MGIPVLVLGPSGSGKSASLRNFEKEEVGIFNVAGKPLPFKKRLNKRNNVSYSSIITSLGNKKLKSYVIDDSQYLLCFEAFENAKKTGYEKFTNMALNFYNLIQFVIRYLPDDIIVYFLHHTEMDDRGNLKAKTLGKMLDTQLTVEGLFSIVLLCAIEGTEHVFITNSDGTHPAKSPMGMFPMRIDNDLKAVDVTIREYYEFGKSEEDGEEQIQSIQG